MGSLERRIEALERTYGRPREANGTPNGSASSRRSKRRATAPRRLKAIPPGVKPLKNSSKWSRSALRGERREA